MTNWKLIGSASTLEDLRKMMIAKLYWSEVNFKEMNDHYIVGNSKGVVQGIRVIKRNKRFRLEMES